MFGKGVIVGNDFCKDQLQQSGKCCLVSWRCVGPFKIKKICRPKYFLMWLGKEFIFLVKVASKSRGRFIGGGLLTVGG